LQRPLEAKAAWSQRWGVEEDPVAARAGDRTGPLSLDRDVVAFDDVQSNRIALHYVLVVVAIVLAGLADVVDDWPVADDLGRVRSWVGVRELKGEAARHARDELHVLDRASGRSLLVTAVLECLDRHPGAVGAVGDVRTLVTRIRAELGVRGLTVRIQRCPEIRRRGRARRCRLEAERQQSEQQTTHRGMSE
jgi:hypothetical protein